MNIEGTTVETRCFASPAGQAGSPVETQYFASPVGQAGATKANCVLNRTPRRDAILASPTGQAAHANLTEMFIKTQNIASLPRENEI
jgi:hypothetical protein